MLVKVVVRKQRKSGVPCGFESRPRHYSLHAFFLAHPLTASHPSSWWLTGLERASTLTDKERCQSPPSSNA